ncbi:winged helix-turn-helix domain-containing tetratricopeptide repeat protein [Falsiroseomonas oryziterrae]|uniref:winged helix-turn-helix domain-containing tetratricopeptide repeat protein n=1 Tax=Falsiroseomonas oryziterrae TaxID=2911368 RepID=UPI001F45B1AD|nr:tetratricopeptide repeat protein [Roseomonas sp. NPKOSM-4]
MRLGFGAHEVDLRRQELRRGTEVVHVEPQVFALLVHLLRHRDRVVSKDELFDTIWEGRIVSEAALSSRINAARKAVGDDGDRQDVIRTIHKRGFRFVAEVQEIPDGADARGPRDASAPGAGEAVRPPAPEATCSPRPSIVVLPFSNLTPEPDTEYFAYGLTEDIVRLLARHRWLDVLSRHSGAPYKGREVDAREIGTALGVRYIVEGSVWRRAGRVRITADLICAETGRQLWSDTHEFALDDLLEIQRSMAEQIAATIEPELGRLEREAAVRRPPRNFDAWDCYQRGLWHLWGFTVPGMEEAQAMFRRALEIDPGFARAHGALAYVHLQSAVMRPPQDRAALIEAAMREARTAVALDAQDCMNLCVLGRAHAFLQDYEEAVALLEQSVELNPSFAQAWYALGFTLIFCGREEEAIACIERATDLSPRDPHISSFHAFRAMAHLFLGDLDAAAAFARQGTRVPNAKHWPFAVHVAALGLLGRSAEARRAVNELRERYPQYTAATARGDFFFCRDAALIERFVEGLKQAGLEDGPPDAGQGVSRRGGTP